MLNILSQEGTRKYETGTYYVGFFKENLQYQTPAIFVHVPGKDRDIAVAFYNNKEDADAIFRHMVLLEGNVQDRMGIFRPTLAVMPQDDPAEIADFLKSNFGYNLFKHKLEKSSENVK